jgi:lipoprotein-anchoring transpeptidase ErfK/SrfK
MPPLARPPSEVTVNRPSLRTDEGLARTAVAGVVTLVVVLLGGAGAIALHSSSSSSASPQNGKDGQPSPTATPESAADVTPADGTVPWASPLTLTTTEGTLAEVNVTGPGGAALLGTLSTTSWTSTASLIPGRAYTAVAKIKGDKARFKTVSHTYTASPAEKVLHATISPGGGAVVGVAQPVIVRFDQKVYGAVNRAAVLKKLAVKTTPAVEGAWRWYNSFEVHWRPATYFASGTVVTTRANLGLLHLAGTTTWGSTHVEQRSFKIGKNYQSTVDIAKHVMVVRLNGKVIRTIKVSTGRDKYPTKGGVHIVLTREKSHTYNSGTVGIPTDGPGGYYEKLPWSMRISNGGAFVHANPDTVRVQGVRNVSHGCVNTSVTDAEWYYYHSQLGDPVNIINAVVKPVISDAGMYDWNIPFSEWKKGNL